MTERLAKLSLVLVVACGAPASSQDRTNVEPTTRDEAEARPDHGDAGTPDPSGGRDDWAASCFATCQNGLFTCQSKGSGALRTADVTPDPLGCSGTLTTGGVSVPLKLHCNEGKICVGEAESCVPATFNAFAFAFTTDSASQLLCTRD